MQLSKEEYARKRFHNGCLVQLESPVTQDNCLASLGKPRDAEQLPSWQNFQLFSQKKIDLRMQNSV